MKKTIFTDESVKMQSTDSISENLTDSDLESEVVGSTKHFFQCIKYLSENLGNVTKYKEVRLLTSF